MFRTSFRLSSIALGALTASTCLVVAAPPQRQECNDPDQGVRLRCKASNVVAQQEATSAMLNEMTEIPESRRQNLMKQTERTKQAHGRSESGEYKQLAKSKSPKCQVAEVMNDGKGDDDGICKGSEDCVEVVGDQIGDDVQPCKTTGNRNEREVCVEICDQDAVASDPDNFDEAGRGQEAESELDDVTDEYVVLNSTIEQALTLHSARQILVRDDDPCSTVFGDRIGAGWMWASLGTKLLVEGLAGIHDKFCNQDAGGFNGASACAIIEGIKAVAVSQWEVVDFIDGNRDSDTIDTTFACMKKLNTSVGDGNAALDSLDAKVEALDAQVKTLQQTLDEVQELLATPQGRREGFPKPGPSAGGSSTGKSGGSLKR